MTSEIPTLLVINANPHKNAAKYNHLSVLFFDLAKHHNVDNTNSKYKFSLRSSVENNNVAGRSKNNIALIKELDLVRPSLICHLTYNIQTVEVKWRWQHLPELCYHCLHPIYLNNKGIMEGNSCTPAHVPEQVNVQNSNLKKSRLVISR
jgi:hypothetical protein